MVWSLSTISFWNCDKTCDDVYTKLLNNLNIIWSVLLYQLSHLVGLALLYSSLYSRNYASFTSLYCVYLTATTYMSSLVKSGLTSTTLHIIVRQNRHYLVSTTRLFPHIVSRCSTLIIKNICIIFKMTLSLIITTSQQTECDI